MDATIIMQDNLIINLLGKDQEKSFRYLYEKYVVQLRYFAAKYIDDKMAVADIVQDAFVRLWEKKSQFQDENAIKAFLYRVVQNACIDLIRHHEAARNYTKHVMAENAEDSFLDNILETEIFQALRTVFNELPPACKEVYLLSLNGKSHEQISQQLDISINTVKKHKNNANHYMRERLKHLLQIILSSGLVF
ncbi:RNA polymerase sigma-70 factor [Butyricimonas hominis]|uniref:RNA polymerase sigma factor n=1 Tax=Butyricimonas hominis TaxID=2763032 RepID=UPI0035167F82